MLEALSQAPTFRPASVAKQFKPGIVRVLDQTRGALRSAQALQQAKDRFSNQETEDGTPTR
jgi:hypothetical protein